MTDQQPPAPRAHAATVAAAGLVVVALVGLYVGLAFAGWSPEQIGVALAALATSGGVLVGAVGKLGSLQAETRRQTEIIEKIDHQTNGVLDARIRRATEDAVENALRRFLDGPVPFTPTDTPPPRHGAPDDHRDVA